MKTMLAIILSFFITSKVFAQSIGRILVLSDSSHRDYFVKDLNAYFSGETIALDTLNNVDLNQFDAITLAKELSYLDQLKAADYIRQGGKLWLPYPAFRRDSLRDTLLHYLGLNDVVIAASEVWFDGYFGVDSEFTYGISSSWEHKDPLQFDASGYPCPIGEIIPVFFEHIGNPGGAMVTAWVPKDRSIKTVVGSGIPPFNQRMFCNYFGLCAPMEVQKRFDAVNDFKVSPNPAHTSITISLPQDHESSVEIADVLGNVLLRKQAMGEMHWKPEHDGPAVYFVRVSTGGAVSAQRVVFER